MHSPLVVLFSIPSLWPKISRSFPANKRHTPFRFWSHFWYIGKWEIYWSPFLTVWHVEPNGMDSGSVCDRKDWIKHIHHWRIQLDSFQHIRRKLLTRCEWCGGRSKKNDHVNTSMGGTEKDNSKWWRGERGLYHGDCLSVYAAHTQCTCDLDKGGPWEHTTIYNKPYGKCSTCKLYRVFPYDRENLDILIYTTKLLKQVKPGTREPAINIYVRDVWARHIKISHSNN